MLLAFVSGWTKREPRRAALLGLGSTLSAFVGYGLMTLSPLEQAQLTRQSVVAFVVSQSPVIAGGLVTGPLFGWFGNRWLIAGGWVGAVVTMAALSLEPLAQRNANLSTDSGSRQRR